MKIKFACINECEAIDNTETEAVDKIEITFQGRNIHVPIGHFFVE
jgi:hypothetical protein